MKNVQQKPGNCNETYFQSMSGGGRPMYIPSILISKQIELDWLNQRSP